MLQRFEDTTLKLAPLPPPKLVPTPDGLANELFGDIAMVTEFVNCYKALLIPEDQQSAISTNSVNSGVHIDSPCLP